MTSARLAWMAAELVHLDAELESPARLAALLGARVPASWPPGEWDADALRWVRERLAAEGERARGWYAWYALQDAADEQPPTLVAAGGYFGPPCVDGGVEIGYSVVPEARRQGIATAMIGVLTARALGTPGVVYVRAHAFAANEASWRALARAGFTRTGTTNAEGAERWERRA